MFTVLPPLADDALRFPETVPVFPLASAALLPGEPLPLHIFEDRYKLMTEVALAGDRLIAMAGFKPNPEAGSGKEAAICPVAGLGRIVMDERLPDGRFNLVLVGIKRVRIKRIVEAKPFLRAEFEAVEDTFSQTAPAFIQNLSKEIVRLGKEVLAVKKKKETLDEIPFPDFESLPYDLIPLGMLCDLFAAALSLSSMEKRMILEETDAIRRSECLIFALRFELEKLKRGGEGGSSLLQ